MHLRGHSNETRHFCNSLLDVLNWNSQINWKCFPYFKKVFFRVFFKSNWEITDGCNEQLKQKRFNV